MIGKAIGFARRVYRGLRRRIQDAGVDTHQNLQIGRGTAYSLANLDGIAPQLVRIGKDCVLAPHCVVISHDASYVPTLGRYRFAPVEIGDRVFIGYGAVVMPGLTIGSDSVVGAGAVVTKDVPPNTVVAGVPARVIGPWPPLTLPPEPQMVEPTFPRGHMPTKRDILALQRRAIAQLRAASGGDGQTGRAG
jgi:serine acetyltransferase